MGGVLFASYNLQAVCIMRVLVLGSSAGGGFPQWNCNCRNCKGVRDGTINAKPRTQSSIAITADDENWILFNTSPDLSTQLAQNPILQPARDVRDTAISAIIYIDSQIDHTTGLLMLREGCPHTVYCTDMVYEDLTTGFPIFELLKSWNGGINRKPLPIDGSSIEMPEVPGLKFTVLPVDGKAPPYSPHRHDPHPGDNIAVVIEDLSNGKKLFYAPGLNSVDGKIRPFMESADCCLVDGTFWRADEMSWAGVGNKLASEMGHLPQSGLGGMIEVLNTIPEPRKILIHINNTNVILDEDSPERAELTRNQIEVSYDGMMIEL